MPLKTASVCKIHRAFIALCFDVRRNGHQRRIDGKERILHPSAGEFQSSDDVRTGFISGNTFVRKEVEFSVVDGLAIFEGDIVLGTVEELTQQDTEVTEAAEPDVPVNGEVVLINPRGLDTEAIGITGLKYRWPRAVIPFGFASSFTGDRSFVYRAMTHWAQNTVFSFVERTSRNESHYRNYVMFERGEGCSSAVGMQEGTFSGKQQISLAQGCDEGSAIHEIGHSVGLWHEQSREDRESYVRILWENIEAGKEHNFNQHITDGDDIGPYDFGSIMHYSRTAFGRRQPDGSLLETIVPHGGQAIGQRAGLSARDRDGVKVLYTDWTPWQRLGGATYSDPAVALGLRKGMVVFVRGTDNQVRHSWQHVRDGEWSGWETLGGIATLSSPAATTYRDGRLVVFVRGTDNAVYHRWHTAPDGDWSGWESLGGTATSGPAAALNAPGGLVVFVRGTDDAIWHCWQGQMNGEWSGWEPLGGIATSEPAAVLTRDGRLVLFVRGTDNAIWHRWQVTRNGDWSGWESLGGTAASKPAATLTPDGRLAVFVRGTDNLIWYRWHVRENGEWSEWKRLIDPRAGGPGATTVPGFWSGNEYWIGWLSVFARGSDNALWHRRLPEMVWGAPPL
jgi:hypothetical protein